MTRPCARRQRVTCWVIVDSSPTMFVPEVALGISMEKQATTIVHHRPSLAILLAVPCLPSSFQFRANINR